MRILHNVEIDVLVVVRTDLLIRSIVVVQLNHFILSQFFCSKVIENAANAQTDQANATDGNAGYGTRTELA